jgi:hypothetical protein
MTAKFQHTATPWVTIHREGVDKWWIGSRNPDPTLKLPLAQMTWAIKAMSGNSRQEGTHHDEAFERYELHPMRFAPISPARKALA